MMKTFALVGDPLGKASQTVVRETTDTCMDVTAIMRLVAFC